MPLRIDNVSKSFGKKQIFENFSYEFKDSGIYLISGDSGIGKTTLLRMIAGLDKGFSGKITYGGISNVSFAFQEYRLFPTLSALENVLTATKKDGENEILRARMLLSELGFSEENMHLLPSELSGGMKQRASLARAILKDSPILLLDEPTKELDEGLSKTVLEIIKRESEKRLVLMVTHKKEDIDFLNGTVIYL